ncbi:hypothetical protein NDU88_002489 [Pleurodeles waltl]|uniref:Retrotransposon gag domain-containing protein n=1 Tax=Pleurodeles waltl TaxID=8319 RepID=A0AAV7NHA8_PLEWA|nr:hypothetical protein NDU88_002489 [Pleurodeles waltl]
MERRTQPSARDRRSQWPQTPTWLGNTPEFGTARTPGNLPQKHTQTLASAQRRFLLRQARQITDESVDIFYGRLKELGSTCTLPDEEDEIRAQFIQGCSSSKLRERILQQPNMPMKDILTLGRSQELLQARAAHNGTERTIRCHCRYEGLLMWEGLALLASAVNILPYPRVRKMPLDGS